MDVHKVRTAFIGCGGIAEAHYRGLKALWDAGCRDFEVVATCDLVAEKAEKLASLLEKVQGTAPKTYTDVETMLKHHGEIQGVYILTEHDIHHTLALQCLEAGKHVMTEKPLAFTLRAGQKVIKAARQKNLTLQVAENYRLAPSERAVSWAVRQGMIGTPRILNWMDVGERLWHWGWRDFLNKAAGGWTLDGGVHFADLFLCHVGEIDEVYAVSTTFDPVKYVYYKLNESGEHQNPRFRQTRSLRQIDENTLAEPIAGTVEDTTSAILRFSNGVIGTWMVTRAAPGREDRTWSLYGSEGVITWQEGLYTRTAQPALTWDELTTKYMQALTTEERERLFPYGVTDTFGVEQKQFFDAIRGEGQVEVTGEVGYKSLAISMAVYESAAIGQPVKLADVEDLKIEVYQAELNKLINLEA